MTTRQPSEKGFILPDEIGSNPTVSICITIPDTEEYRAAFWGHIWQLGRWWIWQHGKPGDTRARDAAQEWRDALAESHTAFLEGEGCGGGMFDVRQSDEEPCSLEKTSDGETWEQFADLSLCLSNTEYRYNEETDSFEGSTDGGATWFPAPEKDPRNNPNSIRAASGFKCNSAASAVRFYQDFIAQAILTISEGTTAISLLSILVTILALFVPGLNIIAFVFVDIITLFISLGDEVLAAAFTSEVWDDLLCIFDCNMGEDGSVSDEQFSTIVEAVLDNYSGDVRTILSGVLQFHGRVGLSNAAAAGLDTDDCSECGCDDVFELEPWADDGGDTVINGLGIDEETGWYMFEVVGVNRGSDSIISMKRVGGGCFEFKSPTVVMTSDGSTVGWGSIFTASADCSSTGRTGFNLEAITYSLDWLIVRWTIGGGHDFRATFLAEPVD